MDPSIFSVACLLVNDYPHAPRELTNGQPKQQQPQQQQQRQQQKQQQCEQQQCEEQQHEQQQR